MSGELPEELIGLDVESEAVDEEVPVEVERPQEETERITVVELAGELYGTHVLDVEEVVRTNPMTRVPRTAEAVDGVTDIRGDITAIINPWVHLDLPAEPRPWERQFVLAFQTGDDEQPVGIRIDRIVGVEPIPVSDIDRDDPGDAPNGDTPLVDGVARRHEDGDVVERIGLLDVDALIAVAGQHPHLADDARADGD